MTATPALALPSAVPETAAAATTLTGLLTPAFIDRVGWDDSVRLLTFPASDALLGWRPGGKGRSPDTDRPEAASVTLPPPLQRCRVVSCHHHGDGGGGVYCSTHQRRWFAASRRDESVDELRWRQTACAATEPGVVSLRGLPPLVVAELLYGLQQRIQHGRRTYWAYLRTMCDRLREQQLTSLEDLSPDHRSLRNQFLYDVRLALRSPETERHHDTWDLKLFGHPRGHLRFEPISQGWLREATKQWALDYLPGVRGKKVATSVAARIRAVARLSESLRLQRDDNGEDHRRLGPADITAFCNRLAFLEGQGRMSAYTRLSSCRMVRIVLDSFRTLGLTRAGGLLDGLSADFALLQSQIPDHIDDDASGRDLPSEVVRLLCDSLPLLDQVGPVEIRVIVELLIDTGRRPDEIIQLPWDCLAHDNADQPVLVYNNLKSHRLGRRLPIAQGTAKVITAQQGRVVHRFPHTPPGQLKLLPGSYANPDGARAYSLEHVNRVHNRWLAALPALTVPAETTVDGHTVTVALPFDLTRVQLYAYRHTYAQRHADAGVPVDVLRELMDHLRMDTTQCYYRVGERRRREAVERVAVMQFDRRGNRVWRNAQSLLDDERVRLAIAEVAVPYGGCSEPSNVAAGGGACPIRFRCVGCGHFRTDASYLPDLEAYLSDLLRNRERLRAATIDADEWARAEATPSDEEIDRVRRLISRVTADLDDLTPAERAEIDNAVAVVRRGRVMLRVTPDPLRIDPGPPTRTGIMTDHLSAGRRADTERRRQKVLKLITLMVKNGGDLTVSAIARQAGVDRSFLYRNPDLMQQIHLAQSAPSAVVSDGAMVSRESLKADLANAHARGNRLEARVRQLEKRLSELLGEQAWHDSGLGAAADIDALLRANAELEQRIAELRATLEDRDRDLAAARAANRQLMLDLNARTAK